MNTYTLLFSPGLPSQEGLQLPQVSVQAPHLLLKCVQLHCSSWQALPLTSLLWRACHYPHHFPCKHQPRYLHPWRRQDPSYFSFCSSSDVSLLHPSWPSAPGSISSLNVAPPQALWQPPWWTLRQRLQRRWHVSSCARRLRAWSELIMYQLSSGSLGSLRSEDPSAELQGSLSERPWTSSNRRQQFRVYRDS